MENTSTQIYLGNFARLRNDEDLNEKRLRIAASLLDHGKLSVGDSSGGITAASGSLRRKS